MKKTCTQFLTLALGFVCALLFVGCGTLDSGSDRSSSGPLGGGGPVLGIDVSDNVGEVDWGRVVAAGYAYAFVKATDGVHYSRVGYFLENWPKMKAAGILRGAYHFYESGDGPEAQADYFASVLERAGGLEKGDLPPVLDFERATSGANVLKFLQRLEDKTGRTPIIYVNESFANSYLSDPAFASYPLWIAEYGVTSPKVPRTWSAAGKTWTFWQNSESGTVPGVPGSGETDLDQFNGSESDLKRFIRQH